MSACKNRCGLFQAIFIRHISAKYVASNVDSVAIASGSHLTRHFWRCWVELASFFIRGKGLREKSRHSFIRILNQGIQTDYTCSKYFPPWLQQLYCLKWSLSHHRLQWCEWWVLQPDQKVWPSPDQWGHPSTWDKCSCVSTTGNDRSCAPHLARIPTVMHERDRKDDIIMLRSRKTGRQTDERNSHKKAAACIARREMGYDVIMPKSRKVDRQRQHIAESSMICISTQ